MPRPISVVSKHGCGLCEKVVTALRSLSSEYDVEVKVLYIEDDRRLHDKYWLTVPVVRIDGKDAFDARHLGGEANYAVELKRLLNTISG